MNNLVIGMKYSYSQRTESLTVVGVLVVLVLLLAITYASSVSMGVSLQGQLNVSAINHVLGHKMPIGGVDSKMEIFPCDDTHRCATSI